MVIETGDHEQSSVVGDILLGVARNKGVVACVTDGMVRDIDGIDELGIPVFARGLSPNSPFKDGPGEIGLAVVVGGVGDRVGRRHRRRQERCRGGAAGARRRGASPRSPPSRARKRRWTRRCASGASEAAWVQATIAAKGVRFVD